MIMEVLKVKKTNGFTLIELLVAMAISSIILIAIFAIINQVFIRSSGGWESFRAYTQAQSTAHQIAKSIRQATLTVVNGAERIFSYYDQDGVELVYPVNPAELTLVKVGLVFQQRNNPAPFRVETMAQ